MAYKRRYRKKTYKRKSTGSFAKKVRKVMVKEAEKKKVYTSIVGTVNSSGLLTNLTTVAQGTTNYQRVGDTIKPLKMIAKYQVSNSDAYNTIRFIVFQWLKSNTTINLGDILLDTTYPMISPYQYDERTNFRVLCDKTVNTDQNGPQHKTGWLVCKRPTRHMVYQTGSSSICDNNIYVWIITDSSTTPNPGVNLYSTFTYVDI